MIRKLARYILRNELRGEREIRDLLRSENAWLFSARTEAEKRWVELNQIMAHRAQQERGLVCVRRGKEYLPVLAVKTGPGGMWEISI